MEPIARNKPGPNKPGPNKAGPNKPGTALTVNTADARPVLHFWPERSVAFAAAHASCLPRLTAAADLCDPGASPPRVVPRALRQAYAD
ncbi:MAG: hypothetical protein ACRDPD_04685 [Streptosporangiaceae bacterium]